MKCKPLWRRYASIVALAVGFHFACLSAAVADTNGLTIRVRPMRVVPDTWVRVFWTWGGRGQGGDPVSGELTAVLPNKPSLPATQSVSVGTIDADIPTLDEAEDLAKQPVIVEEGKIYHHHYLKMGAWSQPVSLKTFKIGKGSRFITLQPKGYQKTVRDWDVEVEVSKAGKSLKRFRVHGDGGHILGFRLPDHRLDANGNLPKGFADRLVSLQTHAEQRLAWLESLPWADWPVMRRFASPGHLSGYAFPQDGPVSKWFGVRTCSKSLVRTELMAMGHFGFNGFFGRGPVELIREANMQEQFSRVAVTYTLGYPVVPTPMLWKNERGQIVKDPPEGAGCPYFPPMRDALPQRVKRVLDDLLEEWRTATIPVDELWCWTHDEIGTVFDRTPEGKSHQGSCPRCRQAFHDYLRSFGLTPRDFDADSWDVLRSTYGYHAQPWQALKAEQEAARQALRQAAEAARTKGIEDAKIAMALETAQSTAKETNIGRKHPLSERGWQLLHYYSRRFNCYAAAALFTAQKHAATAHNQRKAAALAQGESDSKAARQPWLYIGAMRGNNFLMRGHSLDFFNWYRHADNAFMYETSNRDPRIWQWDSYLCDVGRTLTTKNLVERFGIIVKPHRGAAVQRSLSAVARGATSIEWYCFGPEWFKGDSFSGSRRYMRLTSKAAHLIGKVEDNLYGAQWVKPAEVAVIRPRTSEFFENNASWENGKWVYTALTHAHIPVDALDEGFLLSEDLSRYKVIVVSGSHLRRDAAQHLAEWVHAGGTLYTNGGGLARDESDQPLAIMSSVLGLQARKDVELWQDVPRYGAVLIGEFKALAPLPKAGRRVIAKGQMFDEIKLQVGREVLIPKNSAEVLATFDDGACAATRHRYGHGTAYVVGFYAGVEYSADVRKPAYNMVEDFHPSKRQYVAGPVTDAGVNPIVHASEPLVEGVLLQHPESQVFSVVLMNWAYKKPPKRQHIRFTDLAIDIRHPGLTHVKSAWHGDLPIENTATGIRVKLPELTEGDVLLAR